MPFQKNILQIYNNLQKRPKKMNNYSKINEEEM